MNNNNSITGNVNNNSSLSSETNDSHLKEMEEKLAILSKELESHKERQEDINNLKEAIYSLNQGNVVQSSSETNDLNLKEMEEKLAILSKELESHKERQEEINNLKEAIYSLNQDSVIQSSSETNDLHLKEMEEKKTIISKELESHIERQKEINNLRESIYSNQNATPEDKKLIDARFNEINNKVNELKNMNNDIDQKITTYQEERRKNYEEQSQDLKSKLNSLASDDTEVIVGGGGSSKSNDVDGRISEFLSNNSNVTEEEVYNFIREYYSEGIPDDKIENVFNALSFAAQKKEEYALIMGFGDIAGKYISQTENNSTSSASAETNTENVIELPNIEDYKSRDTSMFYGTDFSDPNNLIFNKYQRVGEIVTGVEGGYAPLEEELFNKLYENISTEDKEELLNTDWNAKTEAMLADANLIIQELEDFLSSNEDFGGKFGEVLNANINLSNEDLICLKDYLKDNLENVTYFVEELKTNISKSDELKEKIEIKEKEVEQKTKELEDAQNEYGRLCQNPEYEENAVYWDAAGNRVSSSATHVKVTYEKGDLKASYVEARDAQKELVDKLTEQLRKLKEELDQLKEDLNTVEDAIIMCLKYIKVYDAVLVAYRGT